MKNNDLVMQKILRQTQMVTVQIGLALTVATFIYEIAMQKVIRRSLALNASLIGTIMAAALMIFALLTVGLKQDKSQTREGVLKSTRKEPIYKYMASKIYRVKYRTRTVEYSIAAVIMLAALVFSLVYQKYVYFTISIALAAMFLTILAGIAKNANKITIFSSAFIKELEQEVIDSKLDEEEQEVKLWL